jgi:hypothetical protein
LFPWFGDLYDWNYEFRLNYNKICDKKLIEIIQGIRTCDGSYSYNIKTKMYNDIWYKSALDIEF